MEYIKIFTNSTFWKLYGIFFGLFVLSFLIFITWQQSIGLFVFSYLVLAIIYGFKVYKMSKDSAEELYEDIEDYIEDYETDKNFLTIQFTIFGIYMFYYLILLIPLWLEYKKL